MNSVSAPSVTSVRTSALAFHGPGNFRAEKGTVGSVRIYALFLAKVLEETARATASQHLIQSDHDKVIRISPIDRNVPHDETGLHGIRPIDQINLSGRWTASGLAEALPSDRFSSSPASSLSSFGTSSAGFTSPCNSKNGVLRSISVIVPFGENRRRQSIHGSLIRRHVAGRMVPIHGATEAFAHQELCRSSLLAQRDGQLLFAAIEFACRKRWIQEHVVCEFEPFVKVVAQSGCAQHRHGRSIG